MSTNTKKVGLIFSAYVTRKKRYFKLGSPFLILEKVAYFVNSTTKINSSLKYIMTELLFRKTNKNIMVLELEVTFN